MALTAKAVTWHIYIKAICAKFIFIGGIKMEISNAISNLATGILNAAQGSKSASGSSGGSYNRSSAQSISNVAGNVASARSQQMANIANASAYANWQAAANFNSEEAARQRAWAEYIANTQYQRAVKDMKAAGLNPILAVSNGISGAGVTSGSNAVIGNPATFMGNSIAEQNSASTSSGEGGSSESSWMNSESGLATGLELAVNKIQGIISAIHSSQWVKDATDAVEKWYKNTTNGTKEKIKEFSGNAWDYIAPYIKPNKKSGNEKNYSYGGRKF